MRGAVVLMFVLFALPMGHQGVFAHGHEIGRQATFEWEAEQDLTGDLVVRLAFTPATETQCTIEVAAAGLGDLQRPVRLYVQSPVLTFAFLNGHVIEAHAEELELDTRELTSSSGHWAASLTVSSTFKTPQDLMIIATGLESWDSQVLPEVPFRLLVDCDEGLSIHDLGGSREAIGFTHQSMQGTGASTLSGPSLQFQDQAETGFTSPEVVTAVYFSVDMAALATLQHPEGNVTYFSLIDGPLEHKGGSGDYRFEITSAGSGSMFGIIAGVKPVETLDELLHP